MIDNPMIGVRAKSYPSVTIAGNSFVKPVSTCNLGHGYFCVLDNQLSMLERDKKIEELKALVRPEKTIRRKRPDKTIQPDDLTESDTNES